MRISELSRASGVPIPTIKFYLREGLVPPGERTAANQATYGEGHLRRLRFVRVLVEVGGLSLVAVRRVLEALERGDAPMHDALAAAHSGLRTRDGHPPADLGAVRRETDAWLATLPWQIADDNPGRDELAAALLALRRLGWHVGPDVFGRYVAHADAIAADEIDYVARIDDPQAAVEAAVIGTVVFEGAFSALRRLAHEHHSRKRLGG